MLRTFTEYHTEPCFDMLSLITAKHKLVNATYSARLMDNPATVRLPQPGELTIRDELLGY